MKDQQKRVILGCARFGEFWLFFIEQLFTLSL